MEVSIDYIPKIQARKIFTYEEQLDVLKSGSALHATVNEVPEISIEDDVEVIEEMDTEEVTSFAEIMPVSQPHFTAENHDFESIATSPKDKSKRFITRRTV
jgi:hypothetical protein